MGVFRRACNACASVVCVHVAGSSYLRICLISNYRCLSEQTLEHCCSLSLSLYLCKSIYI